MFQHIFNTKFNLGFHRLVVHSCKKCDAFKSALLSQTITYEGKNESLMKKNVHQAILKSVLKKKKSCIKKFGTDDKTVVLTFDLQRVLECPSISTILAFYKRQLWVYNLCIYDDVNDHGYMYIWNESIASRGAQEIGSRLYRHSLTHTPTDTKKIILYSDSCGGQNRNIKVSLMLKKLLADRKLPAPMFLRIGTFIQQLWPLFWHHWEAKKGHTMYLHWINTILQAKKWKHGLQSLKCSRKFFFNEEFGNFDY